MNDQINIQHNKLMNLDDTMLMYGIYNAETLEKLINTVHEIYKATSSHEDCLQGNTTLHYSGCFTQVPYAYNNMQLIHYFSSELLKINTYHCAGN